MLKKFSKLMALLLGFMLVFTFIGCITQDDNEKEDDGKKNGGDDIIIPGTPDEVQDFTDITAAQLVAKMTVGWNLGNTLDAYGDWMKGSSVTQMETGWGNPKTTKANITAIKNAGFNVIRIPVSWSKATDANFNIREDWMERVVEIVNYAIDNDMYVLLNTHHDEDIFKFTNAQKAASLTAFQKIWEQIASAFKNYDDKLIFEGLNEPRTKGADWEWSGGNAEERANLNEHYKVFVETVRASGGNNDKRMLMLNPYAASGSAAAMNGLVIPADTAKNKIIISYHNYAPNGFALENNMNNTWSADNPGDTSPITDPIDRYYDKFVSKGIPVIIGEFGAQNKNNDATRAAWAEYYVSYARSKGIPCVWWDMGIATGDVTANDLFAIFNRNDNTWYFQGIVDAMMEAVANTTPPIGGGSTGALGVYKYGTDEGGAVNKALAVWVLTPTQVALAQAAGAKLVLQLTNTPAATIQLIWQSNTGEIWWQNENNIWSGSSSVSGKGVTWNAGSKTLTLNLSLAVADYNDFKVQEDLTIILAYFGGTNEVDYLGITSATLE
jgi:endoglucanase